MRTLAWIALCGAVSGCATPEARSLLPYTVTGDAIPAPLTAVAGDPERGRSLLASRDGNCLLCHAVPEAGERYMGNLAPPLSGVGARLTAGQLRLRIVDASLLNRDTIMPAYYRIDGLNRVGERWRGKPILTPQQIEDTVAYLLTLR